MVEDPQGSDELLTAIDLRSSDQAAALHLHATPDGLQQLVNEVLS